MVIISKSTHNKCWQECREMGILLYCWWECRLVQPLWKAIWRHFKKLKMDMPFDPVIPLLGKYPKEPKTLNQKNISTSMFIAGLFIVTKIWKQPTSISKLVDETAMGHLHNGVLLSYKKEENFILCDNMDGPGEHYAKWNKPVREKQIPYDFTHLWNLMKKLN